MAKGKTKGTKSETRQKYLLTKAGERIAGKVSPFEVFSNRHTDRGHEYEEEARIEYRVKTGNEWQGLGFMRRGDVGYSPDGLIAEDGLVEFKTKLYHLQLECLMRNELPSIHRAQCQGGLWVSGRQWMDFVSYSPGLPLFVKRVTRDEHYIATIKIEVDDFLAELNEIVARIKRLAA